MKSNNYLFLLLYAFLITACNKEDKCEIPNSFSGLDEGKIQSDLLEIEQYVVDNGLETEYHSAGFRYKINAQGSESSPNLCNFIIVGYEGRLLDGTVFDGTNPGEAIRFQLSQLIPGWQAGIPLIKEGGSITLYLPSPLGYGSKPAGSIPANSILIFDITLYEVQ